MEARDHSDTAGPLGTGRTLRNNGFSQKQGLTVTVWHHNGLLASMSPHYVYISNLVPQDPMVSLCSPVIHWAVLCPNGHLLPPSGTALVACISSASQWSLGFHEVLQCHCGAFVPCVPIVIDWSPALYEAVP